MFFFKPNEFTYVYIYNLDQSSCPLSRYHETDNDDVINMERHSTSSVTSLLMILQGKEFGIYNRHRWKGKERC